MVAPRRHPTLRHCGRFELISRISASSTRVALWSRGTTSVDILPHTPQLESFHPSSNLQTDKAPSWLAQHDSIPTMAHTGSVAAAAATAPSSSGSSARRKPRTSLTKKISTCSVSNSSTLVGDSGGASSPSTSFESHRTPLRRQSSHKYHTFPTPPPKTPNEQPEPLFPLPSPSAIESPSSNNPSRRPGSSSDNKGSSPLPIRQLALLFLLSLSEQTALNSIQPYLPSMIDSFGIEKVGMYVGLLGSAFALAQLATSFAWGALSDAVGRKPVMLLGTALLAACFACFGLCANFLQAMVVHVAMGLLNGNAAVVPTILGEITDRTNQSIVFGWLPVVYSLGSITGPAVGGLLANTMGDRYPFLAPNIFSAALLAISVLVLSFSFEETLETNSRMEKLAELGRRYCLCGGSRKVRHWTRGWFGRRSGSSTPASSSSSELDEETGLLNDSAIAGEEAETSKEDSSSWRQLVNRTSVTILGTYLIFQLANISFNCLYPVFTEDSEPSGRNLSPSAVGISLSVAGIATICFQIFLFQPIKARLGNLGMYRWAILGLAVSMVLLPWVGHKYDDPVLGMGGKAWLYLELGVVLIIKNACAVGGLSSAMLLITNSAPSNDTLGTINGVAQTLSAAGRSIGPFIAGSLYAATRDVQPKGEAISFCIFGGVAVLGWLGSVFIKGDHLESHEQQPQESSET
ncbi:major facilitator superfamily transporter [Zalerion maritima]|uniref:Major facilitator superfamily transporter n=1 Tax=Zalerion maritima TaxID=339359 RepID=A0AAD5RKY9_9PEZI|nr:major facilitator superfamily transporter [Zalerion maritima]